jgi:hypothetical protein
MASCHQFKNRKCVEIMEVPQSDKPIGGSEPIEAAAAIDYSAAAFAENAGILNRAFCSSLSVA